MICVDDSMKLMITRIETVFFFMSSNIEIMIISFKYQLLIELKL